MLKTYKIQDICMLEKGKQIDTSLLDDNNPYQYINGGISASGYYDKYNTKENTIIVSEGGASCGYVNFMTEKFWCGCHCYRLMEPKVKSEYLYYALKANQHGIMRLRSGCAMPNIKKSSFYNMQIKLDDNQDNQIKVTSILKKVTTLILKRKEQLTKIDFLVKSRFLEMFGDPILNPMGWAISHYGDEFEIMSGGTPKTDIPEYWVNGKISWIGSNLCQNSVLIENDGKFITEKGLNNSSAKIFNKGYILIALVGATIGKVAHLKFSTSTNQNIAGINVPQNENYIPEFVFYNTQFLYPKFMDIGNSKFKMANLSFIRSLQIPIVPIKAQKKFSNFVEQLDKSKFRAKKCLKLFSYMRHLRIIGI